MSRVLRLAPADPAAPDLRTISLGAGVQSTALYRMAALGEFAERPDAAIFADTQGEPAWVYETLDQLDRDHGAVIPIHRVTMGNLAEMALRQERGQRIPRLPLYLVGPDGSPGMLRRECTLTFKIEPIKRKARELLGLRPGERLAGRFAVEEWIGISADEAHRMKPSRFEGFVSRWPLVERGMTRADCRRWLADHGYPIPNRSACVFCPFHNDDYWRRLRDAHPAEFARAVAFDEQIRATPPIGVRGTPYLHAMRKPLAEVRFRHDGQAVLGGFGNECEGMCGN